MIENVVVLDLSNCKHVKGDPSVLSPTLTHLSLKGCSGVTGELTSLILTLLLEGRADLAGCGTISLPNQTQLAQTQPELVDRLSSIKSVSLRKETVGFVLAGELSCFDFLGMTMAMRKIDLSGCDEITGGLR